MLSSISPETSLLWMQTMQQAKFRNWQEIMQTSSLVRCMMTPTLMRQALPSSLPVWTALPLHSHPSMAEKQLPILRGQRHRAAVFSREAVQLLRADRSLQTQESCAPHPAMCRKGIFRFRISSREDKRHNTFGHCLGSVLFLLQRKFEGISSVIKALREKDAQLRAL